MLPLKTDVQIKAPPFVTIILCCACCIVFALQSPHLLPGGVVPLDFVHTILFPDNRLITSFTLLFTSFFLHGGLLHLLGNMWYLWLFGSRLEGTIGHLRFVLLYFVAGIVAMVTQIANDPFSTIPIIGASGAIAGVMGMYLPILPFSKIIIGIPPLFSFRIYAWIFLIVWFWLQWGSVNSSHPSTNTIAWWAHIGGFCFGVLSGVYFRMFSPAPRQKRKKQHP